METACLYINMVWKRLVARSPTWRFINQTTTASTEIRHKALASFARIQNNLVGGIITLLPFAILIEIYKMVIFRLGSNCYPYMGNNPHKGESR
jgi:hypothetical protein